MRELFAAFLGLVVLVFGTTPALESGATIGVVVIAITAVAALAVLAHLVRLESSGQRRHIRPEGSLGVAAVPAQSDPDAAGHARPRAPGLAVTAA